MCTHGASLNVMTFRCKATRCSTILFKWKKVAQYIWTVGPNAKAVGVAALMDPCCTYSILCHTAVGREGARTKEGNIATSAVGRLLLTASKSHRWMLSINQITCLPSSWQLARCQGIMEGRWVGRKLKDSHLFKKVTTQISFALLYKGHSKCKLNCRSSKN